MGIAVVGLLVAVAGWLLLFFGVGVDLEFAGVSLGRSSSVINLHRLAIASNIIYLGYFIVLVGMLSELIGSVKGEPDWLRFAFQGASGSASKAENSDSMAADTAPTKPLRNTPSSEPLPVMDRARIEKELEAGFRKTVRVLPDGSVKVYGFLGEQSFPNVEAARKACRAN